MLLHCVSQCFFTWGADPRAICWLSQIDSRGRERPRQNLRQAPWTLGPAPVVDQHLRCLHGMRAVVALRLHAHAHAHALARTCRVATGDFVEQQSYQLVRGRACGCIRMARGCGLCPTRGVLS